MSSQRSLLPRSVGRRRARPVFDGPSYKSPQYHSRIWGRLVFLIFVLLLAGVVAFGGGLYWALHRAQSAGSRQFVFPVGPGDSVNTIATRLQDKHIIDNSLLFKVDARLQNLSGKLKPGNYALRPNMSIDQMIGALSVLKVSYISVLIPEGYRSEQIAAVLQHDGINPAGFLREVRHPNIAYLSASILADKPRNASLEGYLFPNTYFIQPHSSGKEFAKIMVRQLDKVFTPPLRAQARRHGRSVFQTLTLASIVEREARVESERPLIAGVYANRLRIGMKLDADPSVQYSAGTPKNWWPVLRTQAVNVNPQSTYNTYTHAGLPPGPIANPGLLSIQAAVNPQKSGYFYFLAIPNGHGHHVFATTLQQQIANQQKYGY
ncbi:MAG: endolytic transglycosylase MltG [Chloroflexota bacterium]